MSVAAYIRVSSRSQDHAYQRREIERAARARGEVIGEWYAEKETGKRLSRPELDRLRQAVREGHVTRIWVWRIDRLTRSGIVDTLRVIEELRHGGAAVASVADGFALDGPGGEIVLAVLAWAAQVERAKIQENLEAARARVEASGGSWGRPPRVDETLAKRIHRMRNEGPGKMTIRAIAIALKVPRSTVAAVVSGKGAYRRRSEPPKKKPLKSSIPPPSE